MAIAYDPDEASNVWPTIENGQPIPYDATLKSVKDSVSKSSGNEMEVWEIEVFRDEGRPQTITEYVTAKAAFKIKQLAAALGRSDDFKAMTFKAEDYIGSNFTVELVIEAGTGNYDDKNKIGRFKPAAPPANQVEEALKINTPRRDPRPALPARRAPVGAGASAGRRPAPEQPYGDEQQFKDDDIPF